MMFHPLKAFSMLSVCVLFLTIGCNSDSGNQSYKYTIWVGGEFVQTGYKTDAYEIKDQMIEFLNKKGKVVKVPLCNVGSIEKN